MVWRLGAPTLPGQHGSALIHSLYGAQSAQPASRGGCARAAAGVEQLHLQLRVARLQSQRRIQRCAP
jgi:hypothetical protein